MQLEVASKIMLRSAVQLLAEQIGVWWRDRELRPTPKVHCGFLWLAHPLSLGRLQAQAPVGALCQLAMPSGTATVLMPTSAQK